MLYRSENSVEITENDNTKETGLTGVFPLDIEDRVERNQHLLEWFFNLLVNRTSSGLTLGLQWCKLIWIKKRLLGKCPKEWIFEGTARLCFYKLANILTFRGDSRF